MCAGESLSICCPLGAVHNSLDSITMKNIKIVIILVLLASVQFLLINRLHARAAREQRDDSTKGENIRTDHPHSIETGSGEDHTVEEYRKKRVKNFYSWFEGNGTDTLRPNADEEGAILDFAIAGFPKCGTTTMMANLGYIAPMPVADICTPAAQTVYYSYKNWPRQFSSNTNTTIDGTTKEKLLRGTKCPGFINDSWLLEWSHHLPRTKLIIGIRHPVKWFQSFWNMQANNRLENFATQDPYSYTELCNHNCVNNCPRGQLFCMHRGRFHIPLARLGKTALSDREREFLAPNDWDGGTNLINNEIQNSIFVYEQEMLNENSVWEELATYLNVSNIPHNRRHDSHGRNNITRIDFCDDKYDAFRAKMMPIAHELSSWLLEYFIPVGKDKSRTDVIIPRTDIFGDLVEDYKKDFCGKLIRLDDGTYVLGGNRTRRS